jgi:hypothetical protein
MTDSSFLNSIVHAPITVYPREQEFIDQFIFGVYFNWFWQERQTLLPKEKVLEDLPKELREYTDFYNGPFLSHTLLPRNEDENISHLNCESKVISPYFEFFIEIFNRFMHDQGLKFSKIFRANLNLSWHNGNCHTAPHLDHKWPHKNFIMYLNSCDRGETIVWPNDFLTSYFFPCKKNTAVTFKQQWHAHRYPTPGSRRMAFVVTYI